MKHTEKRFKFSLPETFLLGLLVTAGIASAKAYFDVRDLKIKVSKPQIRIDKLEKKIDNLDSKFDRKFDKVYELLIN